MGVPRSQMVATVRRVAMRASSWRLPCSHCDDPSAPVLPQYPLVPPAVRYRTRIFHPNVHFKARRAAGEDLMPAAAREPRRVACRAVHALLMMLRQNAGTR